VPEHDNELTVLPDSLAGYEDGTLGAEKGQTQRERKAREEIGRVGRGRTGKRKERMDKILYR